MLKTLLTLARGTAAKVEERAADAQALPMLDQQLRDAAADVERGRRALAVALAQRQAEERRLAAAEAQGRLYEERALAGLRDNREDLATRAAEAVLAAEAEARSIRQACRAFDSEIATLRAAVTAEGRRLAELGRGRRIAAATEAVRRLRGAASGGSALRDAEATLRRLRERQVEEADVHAALAEIDPVAMLTALEAQSPDRQPTAADVLARLREGRVAALEQSATQA